jgi:hypothetical protein
VADNVQRIELDAANEADVPQHTAFTRQGTRRPEALMGEDELAGLAFRET